MLAALCAAPTLSTGLAGAGAVTSASPARTAAAPSLELVAEDRFTVAPDGELALTVRIPPSLDPAVLLDPSNPANVTVTAFAPVRSRDAVTAAIDGDTGAVTDQVTVAVAAVRRPASDQLAVVVPIETATRQAAALRLPDPGLYPVTVALEVGGAVVAELTTFVNRDVGAGDDQLSPLSIALIVGTPAGVTLDATGHAQLPTETIGALTDLTEVLETTAMPATVQVAPKLLGALRELDPRLADRMSIALANAQLLSAPLLPLDPSAAAAAGQQELYGKWLVEGEDLLETADVRDTPLRTASTVAAPLSEPGAMLLRRLGTRLLVFTPEIYDSLDDSPGPSVDTTQLVHVRLSGAGSTSDNTTDSPSPDGATLDGIVVDRKIAAILAAPPYPPVLEGIYVAADLLAERQQISDFGGDPSRHSVVVGTDRLGLPDRATLATVTARIAETPGLAVVGVGQLTGRTDTLLRDGQEVSVGLPATTANDISRRIAIQTDLQAATDDAASMLTAEDPRPAQWHDLLQSLASSAVADADAETVRSSLTAQFAAIRGAVEPPVRFRFTLTGRTGEVRLQMRNTSDQPLKVVIHLDAGSAKLAFPDGDQTETLAADQVTPIKIRIKARSNGRFPVNLAVLTPSRDLLANVPLTATVTALSGLGNLVTGAALLMLFTWWANHIRLSRRRRGAAAAAARHPVSVAAVSLDGGSGAGVTGLAADRARSTIPPS